jgi:hypothetical protein
VSTSFPISLFTIATTQSKVSWRCIERCWGKEVNFRYFVFMKQSVSTHFVNTHSLLYKENIRFCVDWTWNFLSSCSLSGESKTPVNGGHLHLSKYVRVKAIKGVKVASLSATCNVGHSHTLRLIYLKVLSSKTGWLSQHNFLYTSMYFMLWQPCTFFTEIKTKNIFSNIFPLILNCFMRTSNQRC